MKEKLFECLDCDCKFNTTKYWFVEGWSDNGTEEYAEADCPNCNNLVLED
jgi:hypothetical protein